MGVNQDVKLSDGQKGMITVLRILSCIGVFIIHFPFFKDSVNLFSQIAKYGQDGLWMFYVLSGLLICISYTKKGGVKQYYIGRLFRIVPVAWTWLLVMWIINRLILGTLPIYDPRYFLSVTFTNMIIPSNEYFNWNGMYAYGTLSNFMVFYLMIPFVFKVVNSYKKSVIFLICTMLISKMSMFLYGNVYPRFIGGDSSVLAGHAFTSILWYFGVGIVIFWSLKEKKFKYTLMIFASLYLLTATYDFAFYYNKGILLGLLLLVLLELTEHFVIRVKVLRIIERYTFTLYLCHLFVMHVIEHLVNMYSLGDTICIVLDIIGSIIVSLLLYHCICKPFDIIKNKVLKLL